jgi:hypothetical protein
MEETDTRKGGLGRPTVRPVCDRMSGESDARSRQLTEPLVKCRIARGEGFD